MGAPSDSLCKEVCGKEASHRLCSLINNWRDRSKPLFETNKAATAVRLAVCHVTGSLSGDQGCRTGEEEDDSYDECCS